MLIGSPAKSGLLWWLSCSNMVGLVGVPPHTSKEQKTVNTWMKGAHSKRSVGLSLPLAILTALVAAVAVLLFALSSTAQAEIPVPGDDVYTIMEGNPLLVGLDGGGGSVLNNDTDLEGDPLQAFLDQVPSHGIVDQFNPDGSFSYFPAPDYNGDDSFTYVASDGSTTPENLNKATVH